MSDIPEALGTAAEGVALGAAIEPARGGTSGDAQGGGQGPGTCLNCGTALAGPYCHACGQPEHIHRTIGAFLHDLMHGALHFEGKIWRTLPMLAWRPGQLTRRFIDGQRARFVSPMALFLFTIFLMFACFQLAGISAPTDIKPKGIEPGSRVESNLVKAGDDLEAAVVEAREKLAAMAPGDPARPKAQEDLATAEASLAAYRKTQSFIRGDGAIMSGKPNSGIAFVDKALVKWRDHPELMLYKLQANFYKFSWLLIPLSLPFVWLLFAWRRQFGLYDHAVFITYSLSFVSLLYVVLALLSLGGLAGGWILFAATLLPLWHMHRQLKGTYGIGNFGALWRVAVLSVFIVVILLLFLQLLIVLGVMG